MIELKNSKTTYLGKASGRDKYSLDAFIGAVQMREPGAEWRDIKPHLVRGADGWHIDGAPYYAEIKDDGTRLFCPDKNERSRYLRLPAPSLFSELNKNVVLNPPKLDGQILPNQITLPADWGEFRIIFSNTGMHFEVLFTKAPPASVFGKDSPRLLLDVETAGFNIEQILNATSGIGIPKPRLMAANPEILAGEPWERWLDWNYKNGQLELGFDFGELEFPILLKNTTIDEQVGASADDGYADDTGSEYTNTDTISYVGYENSGLNKAHSAHRFTGITIPQSSTIDVCYISCYEYGSSSVALTKLSFEKSQNPGQISDYSDFMGRTLTTAKVDWDGDIGSPETWCNSPSLVSPCQELINAYGLSSQAMIVFHKDDGTPTDQGNGKTQRYRSYDYSGNIYGVKLHIEYTSGGATEKTSAETGTGADDSALLANITKAESGDGTDSKLSFQASLAKGDSGNGIDTKLSYLAGLTGTDSGDGTEQSLLSLLIASADTGAGIEAAAILLAGIMKGDSGSGSESILDRYLNLTEYGDGVDTLSALIAAILASDTGSGIDQSTLTSIVAKLSADTGSGAEMAELLAGLVSVETGLGVDTGMIVGLKLLFSGDEGTSGDVLKALINTSGSGSDMKLPGRQGRVGIPSKGVSL